MTVKKGKPTNTCPDITTKLVHKSIVSKNNTNNDKIVIGEDTMAIMSGEISLRDVIKKLREKKNGIEEVNPDDQYYNQID